MFINTVVGAFGLVQLTIDQISTIVTNACSLILMNVKIVGARANEASWKGFHDVLCREFENLGMKSESKCL